MLARTNARHFAPSPPTPQWSAQVVCAGRAPWNSVWCTKKRKEGHLPTTRASSSVKLIAALTKFDTDLRRVMAVYLIIPLFTLAIPVGLWTLAQSYDAYRALADHGVQTAASIQSVTETGGRVRRNAVTAAFVATDGRTYVAKVLYALDSSRHLRPGMRIGVIYQRDLPSNNAPSLAYARGELRSIVFFIVLMSGLSSLLAWIYRDEYASIYARVRHRTAYA